MVLVDDSGLVVRELRESDAGFLVRWLSDSRVLQFYEGRDRPHDEAMVRRVFYDASTDEVRCLVEWQGRPVGYLQFYQLSPDGQKELGIETDRGQGENRTAYGLDLFIGEPELWGHGLGARLVGTVLRYLAEEKKATLAIVDPQTWNARAIRCYEKAGFRKTHLLPAHEMYEGQMRDCCLMECPLPPRRTPSRLSS